MSARVQEPLKSLRLVTLGLAWCFAVIAASVGLNALIKSNQQKSHLKKLAPPPTVVVINTDDIYHVGISATTASLVIAILVSQYFLGALIPKTKAFVTRTLRIQAALLLLACTWLFATMIPYMIFFMHRHAKVTAFIGATQLPDAVIKGVEKSSGSTSVYKDIGYLRLFAILPWFALFFALIAVGVLFAAAGRVTNAPAPAPAAPSSPSTTVKEDASHHEKVSV